MPKSKLPKVFLDANIVIQAGKPPGGPTLGRVADLVEADLISVLTTDLTIREVAKKHAENDYEVIKEVGRPHFRKIVEEAVGTKLPDVSKAQLKETFSAAYTKSTRAMFSKLQAETLSIDDVKPSVVFDAYADGSGFFGGEGKKDQFPDAFIFECLKAEASAKSPVIIVSDDGDFTAPVKGHSHITLVKSLPALFQKLGLQVDAPELDEFLQENHDDLLRAVNDELENWGLQVTDVEDVDIEETNVTEVEMQELISFGSAEEGGSILAVGRMLVKANVSYSHPDWDTAMYDSEDKVLVPFESVSGETEVAFEVDFSMSIVVSDEGEPGQIEEFGFKNDKFQYVELHPHDPNDYR